MDKDPEIQELAYAMAEKLGNAFVAGIKAKRKVKDGTYLDDEMEPNHILDELNNLRGFFC